MSVVKYPNHDSAVSRRNKKELRHEQSKKPQTIRDALIDECFFHIRNPKGGKHTHRCVLILPVLAIVVKSVSAEKDT